MFPRHQLELHIAICFAICSSAITTNAQDFVTGAAFEKASSQPITQTLKGLPIGKTLADLTKQYSICIFLDRRVDPDLRIKRNPKEIPLKSALYRLASDLDLGVVQFGSIWYVGPIESAAKLHQAHDLFREKMQFLDQEPLRKWNRKNSLQWQRLSQPKEIVESLIADIGMQGQGTDQIPFDIWPAQSFPELSIADQLFLLLYGFDLRPRLTAADGSFVIEPIEAVEHVTQTISRSLTKRHLETVADSFPLVTVKSEGNKRTFTGPPVDVYRAIWSIDFVEKTVVDPNAPRFFTLENTTATRGAILKKIAQQIGVDFQFDPETEADLQQRITINETNVGFQQLIDAVLKDANCTAQLTDDKLMIWKKQ